MKGLTFGITNPLKAKVGRGKQKILKKNDLEMTLELKLNPLLN